MASILIVDDVIPIRKALRNLLTEMGHDVVGEATNGQEGYSQYDKLKPDVVTMDISMPVMDGIDAVGSIMRSHPDANIIMVSSQGAKERVIEAVKNGAKGYILKPFNKANIKEAIDKLSL